MYMELPPGIRKKQEKSKDYVLRLLANLYRQKQAGCIWNQYMTDKFKDTVTDECAFSHDDHFIVYDNMLMLIIRQLNKSGPDIEDQGCLTDYVRVNIKKTHDGMCKLPNEL
ncbi:hypothetical protein ACHAW6_000642 [Cyclotella cf. meneghiniana]